MSIQWICGCYFMIVHSWKLHEFNWMKQSTNEWSQGGNKIINDIKWMKLV